MANIKAVLIKFEIHAVLLQINLRMAIPLFHICSIFYWILCYIWVSSNPK